MAVDQGEFVPFRSDDDRAWEYPPAEMDEDNQEQHPSWTPPPGARSAAEIDKELQLCAALSSWCPWTEPTIEIVQAIQTIMAQDSHDSDVSAKCLARRCALQALQHEEVHADSLP